MLSHISNRSRVDYLVLVTWVAMWDRFFRQRAYIGITRSRMRWYVRKFYTNLWETAAHYVITHSRDVIMLYIPPQRIQKLAGVFC